MRILEAMGATLLFGPYVFWKLSDKWDKMWVVSITLSVFFSMSGFNGLMWGDIERFAILHIPALIFFAIALDIIPRLANKEGE